MANRVLLYSIHDSDPTQRDLGEWPYMIPLLYYLLIGFEPKVVPSRIYEGSLALLGLGEPARTFALDFLEALSIRLPQAQKLCQEASAIVEHPSRQGSGYLLEPADIWAMDSKESLEEMATKDAALAIQVVEQLRPLRNDPHHTFAPTTHWVITDALSDWKLSMGLELWPGSLKASNN